MYSTRSKRKHKKPPDTKSFLGGSASGRSKGGDSKRPNQMPFVRGSDNVFEDVGFASGEAANLKIRADLMLDLRRFIHARRWTQAEAAAFFGETQPRISNLMKGEIGRFSVDKLINMLACAGILVRVKTEPKAA